MSVEQAVDQLWSLVVPMCTGINITINIATTICPMKMRTMCTTIISRVQPQACTPKLLFLFRVTVIVLQRRVNFIVWIRKIFLHEIYSMFCKNKISTSSSRLTYRVPGNVSSSLTNKHTYHRTYVHAMRIVVVLRHLQLLCTLKSG